MRAELGPAGRPIRVSAGRRRGGTGTERSRAEPSRPVVCRCLSVLSGVQGWPGQDGVPRAVAVLLPAALIAALSAVRPGRSRPGDFTRLRSVCRVLIHSQERENSEPDYIPINGRFKCVQGTASCSGLSRGSRNPLPFARKNGISWFFLTSASVQTACFLQK